MTENTNRPVSNQQMSTSRTRVPQRAAAPGPDGPDPNGGGGGVDDDDDADRRRQKITKAITKVV